MSPKESDKEKKDEKIEEVEEVVNEEVNEESDVEETKVEEVQKVEEAENEETDLQKEATDLAEESKEEEEVFEEEKTESSEEKNLWEKFLSFEGTTKAGIICSLVLLFGFLFANWIDYTWWIVLILAGVSIRNLYKQKIDLEDEKPFESRISAMFLYGVIILLVIRDLMITMKLDQILDVADIRHIREILQLF